MDGRNRDLETGCQLTLIALVVVACIAGIPPIVDVVANSIVQSRINAAPTRFACGACGEVEAVDEVTLGATNHDVSTVSGEGFAMLLGLLSGKLGTGPVKVIAISVRLQDGSLRVFHEGKPSAWQPGDRVRVTMGRIKPLS